MTRQGFWTKTESGIKAHVLGDPQMSDKSLTAVHAVIEAACKIPIPDTSWKLEGKAYASAIDWVSLLSGSEKAVKRQYDYTVSLDPNGTYRIVGADGAVIETTEVAA